MKFELYDKYDQDISHIFSCGGEEGRILKLKSDSTGDKWRLWRFFERSLQVLFRKSLIVENSFK